MQKIFSITGICLILLCCAPSAGAQVTDTLASKPDSVAFVKQLVKEYFLQQLQQSASYKKIQQNKITGLLNDSSAVDTIGKLIMLQMEKVKHTAANTSKSIVGAAAGATKQLLQQQFAKLIQTQQLKGIFAQFTGMVRQPLLKWQGGSVGITGQTAPRYSTVEPCLLTAIY